MTNLHDVLRQRMAGKRAWLRPHGGEPVSYGELGRLVDRMDALLRARGLEPGDRLVFQGEKSWQGVALYLATLRAGGVFVPLNPAYTPRETDYFVEDCAPRQVVRDAVAFADEAEEAALEAPASTPRAPGDMAAIIYTSGTTGRSKGAVLTHGGLLANARALQSAWGFSADDVLLHALPIFHVHGLFIALHCALLSGAPMLWHTRFDEDAVLADLGDATVLMGVPTFYTRLLARQDFDAAAARGVRLFVCGSAPLLPSTFDAFAARTGKAILERYGMSEALVIATNPLDGPRLAGSVGWPVPGLQLRIAGGEAEGEVEIRGDSVFAGYWQMPDKTGEAFTADGWFRTGDVGRLDADGRLWLSGRSKDLIISGGFNVYLKEVELVLDSLPGVVESAVVGAPHPDFGEAVVAFVVGEGREVALIAAARDQLAAYKTPKRVLFVDTLPRNAMGKVQKTDLRAEAAALFQA